MPLGKMRQTTGFFPHLSRKRLACLAVIGIIFMTQKSLAQKEMLYEQYLQNPLAINPAFAGVREDFTMTVLLRRRWIALQNSPTSQSFAADGRVAKGKIGLGIQALNYRMSPFVTSGVYGALAFHHTMPGGLRLSIGGQGGVSVLPFFDFTSGVSTNRAMASVGAGIWIENDKWSLGISQPELLAKGFGNRFSQFRYRRPLFIQLGYTAELDSDILLLPHVLIGIEQAQKLRFDIGSRVWYKEKIGAGATFRSAAINYIQLSLEAQVSQAIRFGYNYNSKSVEIPSTNLQNVPLGVHEIVFKYVPSSTRFHKN